MNPRTLTTSRPGSPLWKRALVVGAVALVCSAAQAATRATMVTGAGMGIDNDQSSAHETADSQAQNNLQNACPGTLTSVRKIYDQCSPVGETWTCNINYTAICQY